jgi:hypothetical protein
MLEVSAMVNPALSSLKLRTRTAQSHGSGLSANVNNPDDLLGFNRLDDNGHTGCHPGGVAAIGGRGGASVSDDRCLVAPYANSASDLYG